MVSEESDLESDEYIEHSTATETPSDANCEQDVFDHNSDEDDDSNEMFFQARAKVKSKTTWASRVKHPDLTDDEKEDDETLRTLRKENQAAVRKRVKMALTQGHHKTIRDYVPDQKSEQLARKWVVSPLLQKSPRWRTKKKEVREEIKTMVMEGILPTSKDKVGNSVFTRTAGLYYNALKTLLGLIQEHYYLNNRDRLLVDGNLQLWQFFDFKGEYYLEPETEISSLIDKIPSNTQQLFAFSGYLQLLQGLIAWLSTSDAKEQFLTRRKEGQEKLEERAMMLVARQEISDEMKILANIRVVLKQPKPFGEFHNQIEYGREKKLGFQEKFEGYNKEVDVKAAVNAYMRTNETRELFCKLSKLARTDPPMILSKNEMVQVTEATIIRKVCKAGHRIQVWGSCFIRVHFVKARNNGLVPYPYKLLEGTSLEQGDAVEAYKTPYPGPSGETQEFTVIEPHQDDIVAHDDYDDSVEAREGRDLLLGYACFIENQKTMMSYPCWLFFSQFDMSFLLDYEVVATTYLKANNIPVNEDTPFFINSKGT